MSSILEEIQVVRALRKTIRDPKVPVNITKAIENIHQCIKVGTDSNGWKKVEWRGQNNSGRATPPTSASSNQKGGAFFNSRSSGDSHASHASHASQSQSQSQPQQSSGNAYSYNNRSRAGFMNQNQKEAPASIPLTCPTPVISSSAADPDAFEMVRRGHWQDKSDGFRPQKYVSKFKKTSEKVEDTILNTILLGKLNKFSQPNYNEIKEFITHIIASGQTDMIKCFMKLVFEKAASEEVFCPLYAKLLSELSADYPVLLTEMTTLYNQYMEIFEEVADGMGENYNELCKRNVEKKYRRGYSQFLAELIKHNVVDTDTFMKIITKIIRQVELNAEIKESIKLNEEFADCFMKIMKAIKMDAQVEEEDEEDNDARQKISMIRDILKKDMLDRIKPLCERNVAYLGISNKARFTFLSIYEDIQKL